MRSEESVAATVAGCRKVFVVTGAFVAGVAARSRACLGRTALRSVVGVAGSEVPKIKTNKNGVRAREKKGEGGVSKLLRDRGHVLRAALCCWCSW